MRRAGAAAKSPATSLGVVTFDPMMMVAGLAALLGSAASGADRPAYCNICLVEDAPANQDS
jgi:hypothetical protein